MGIFKEMYDGRHFENERDYRELLRMLSEAIDRGYVEQIPVMNPIWSMGEVWLREKETARSML